MAGEALLITQFLAAGLMLLLAAWMLWLNFHGRVVRAFALFLVLRATTILCNQFSRILGGDDTFGAEYWLGVRGYFDLAVVPSLAWFLLVYAKPKATALLRWSGWGLLLGTLGVELAYAVDHCVAQCGKEGLLQVGPVGALMFGAAFASSCIGLVLIRRAKSAVGHAKSGAFLTGTAFFLQALFDTFLFLASVLATGLREALDKTYAPNAWQALPVVFAFLTCLVLALTVAAYVLRPEAAAERRHMWGTLAAAAGIAAVAIGLVWVPSPGPAIGLIRLAFPLLVVLAILRHRMFGIDTRIRAGISRATVAGIILASFFVVNKVVENLVANRFPDGNAGIYVGGAVAGLLLFALSPLQKLGERVASATTRGLARRGSRDDRLRFYRDQAEIAWSDGVLGRRERMLLEHLRQRLGLPADAAASIEHQLVASGATPKQKADAGALG